MKFIRQCILLCAHKRIGRCLKSSEITWPLYHVFGQGIVINDWKGGKIYNALYDFTTEITLPGERIYTAIDSLIIGTWMMSYIYHHLHSAWYTALLIIFCMSIKYTETLIMIIIRNINVTLLPSPIFVTK